jgi:hypothetical protein
MLLYSCILLQCVVLIDSNSHQATALACRTLVSATKTVIVSYLHQVSHTFVHVDENPYNADLGNCLDYTNTPENNQLPGEANFARLRTIYLEEDTAASSSTGQNSDTAVSEQRDAVLDGDGRRLRHTEVVTDTGHGKDEHGQYFRRVIVRHYLPVQ